MPGTVQWLGAAALAGNETFFPRSGFVMHLFEIAIQRGVAGRWPVVVEAFVQALAKSDGQLLVLLFLEAEDLRGPRWKRDCAPLDSRWEFLSLDQRSRSVFVCPV